MESVIKTWGTQPHERELAYPCDDLISQPDEALYRGVTINAAPARAFRWLCQMRVAPYSYDWIDNGGRKSPPKLTPGLEDLVVAQDVMRIFKLAGFEKDRHLTLRLKAKSPAAKTFGDLGVSYVILPLGNSPNRCRLLVKLVVKYPLGLYGRMMRVLLPTGDLVMMRRQLLNMKYLAEETEREASL